MEFRPHRAHVGDMAFNQIGINILDCSIACFLFQSLLEDFRHLPHFQSVPPVLPIGCYSVSPRATGSTSQQSAWILPNSRLT